MVPNIFNINVPTPFVTGVDIAASDLRRGRLHGIPNYHDVRKAWFSDNVTENSLYGKPGCAADDNTPSPDPLGCFTLLTSDSTLANKLRDVYGKLNRIDPFVGVLIESPMAGSALGPTNTRIILDQFKRVRDGDR
jgi:peroxidase